MRQPIVEAAGLTLAGHLQRLKDLSDAAEKSNQMSAAITAEVARGKASGLYVEKVEHSGSVGIATMTDEQLAAKIAEKMKALHGSGE